MKRYLLISLVLLAAIGQLQAAPARNYQPGPAAMATGNSRAPLPRLVSPDIVPLSPVSMNALSSKDRQTYMKNMRERQHQRGLELEQQLYERERAALQERLAQDVSLNETQKAEQLKKFTEDHMLRMQESEKRYQENMAFFDKLESDTALTAEQKRAALQDFFNKQREQLPTADRMNNPLPLAPRGRPGLPPTPAMESQAK